MASSSNKNISYANAEAYTELYFTPTQTVKKNIFLINNLKFSFAIHNVESNDITYTYQIIFSKNGKRIILKQNNVFVENNQTKVLVESIPVTKDYSNGKITVLILNNNQQITLHLPNAS
ncbi:MAG TPA: hypothetical protein VLF93_02585 [Candidatus Saccharimonadales bacterium]|nr:hypothetical protein [Candidatus Saccharimonadales bacterium]